MARTTLDPYAVLGIPAGTSHAEATRAHRRLAKQFHPDINSRPDAVERMQRINEAWRILSDPARRARYDASRRAGTWSGPGSPTERATTTWTTWPENFSSGRAPTRRPARPDSVERSFGDHPAIVVVFGVSLALFIFFGTWLGSLAR
jgi:curved DNA-binding protein CbpA